VNATVFLPHQARTSPQDLEAMARVWKWESTIREHLPLVLASEDITVLFQAIFDVRGDFPLLRAYEALARFPAAERIPTGLWFSVAAQLGLVMDLELATARRAMELMPGLPEGTLLFVNASPMVASTLVDSVPREVSNRLVFDLPCVVRSDPHFDRVSHDLRQRGVGIAVDDIPMEDVPHFDWGRERPDFLKVDVISGVDGETAPRTSLARAARWCSRNGVILIAKRLERVTDLGVLRDLGIGWAQGYSLASPTEL
jgi:EAL domain-containing protein (putative c-di-GMP-specific phosphodiesterase class I)